MKKSRIVILNLCNVLLALYIAIIVILHNFADVNPRFGIAIFCGLTLCFLIYQGIKLFMLRYDKLTISCNTERGKLSLKIFVTVSIVVFVIFIICLLANYPGKIVGDNITQWEQIQSGKLHNWHPAIHTMILWLIVHIVPRYPFVVGVQILIFSILSGYMAATLAAWGIKKQWIALFLLTIISTHSSYGMLLCAWKDTTFTICLLCLAVYMVNIVLSNGQWLSKWQNVIALSVIAALASIMRHNGILFTVPLGLFTIIYYRKITRNALYVVIGSILVLLGITQILYRIVKVEPSTEQTYVESVGLPMTILCGVITNNPKALDPQTKEFLNKIASDEEYRLHYNSEIGYNSIKWVTPASKIVAKTPPMRLMRMTLRTIINAPKESLGEAIMLTSMVWDPLEWQYSYGLDLSQSGIDSVYPEYEQDSASIQPLLSASRKIYLDLRAMIDLLSPSRIFTSLGLHMLLLLLAGVYSMNHNLKGKAFLLFIPSAVYNLGTMLLLSAPDYRMFHFNTVITLPLILALMAKSQDNRSLKS